jgi:hypothetical protein
MSCYTWARTHLILEVVPPVWPRLLDAATLLDDSLGTGDREAREGHGDTVVVVAVNRHAPLESVDRRAVNDNAVVKLVGLDAELLYGGAKARGKAKRSSELAPAEKKESEGRTELIAHALDAVALLDTLVGDTIDARDVGLGVLGRRRAGSDRSENRGR